MLRRSWAWRPTAIPRSSVTNFSRRCASARRTMRYPRSFLDFNSNKFAKLDALLGPPRYMDSEILPRHADIAAALQEATNAAVMALVRRLKRKVPFDKLCLAGGVALNCVTNELVRRSGEFSRCVHTLRAARCRHRDRRRLCRALRKAEKCPRAGQLHAVSRSRVQPARNSGGGQVGRSHAAAKQVPRARCCAR